MIIDTSKFCLVCTILALNICIFLSTFLRNTLPSDEMQVLAFFNGTFTIRRWRHHALLIFSTFSACIQYLFSRGGGGGGGLKIYNMLFHRFSIFRIDL